MSEEKKPTLLEQMEMERNQRMMVLMTALRDYVGAVNAEINELRNLVGIQQKNENVKVPQKKVKKKSPPIIEEKPVVAQ